MGEKMKKSKIILLLSSMLLIVSLFAMGCGPKAFDVTFDGNGGTLVSGETVQTVESAADIVAPEFSRTGYTFASWDKTLSEITASTTVKAQWTANTYTVTFNANDSESSPAVISEASKTYTFDADMPLPTATREGYVFAGWRKGAVDGELLNNNSKYTYAEDFTAYATWTVDDTKTYTISYDLAGGSMATGVENPTTYKVTDADITLQNPTKSGYKFLGWAEGTANPVANVVITSGSAGNKAYTAVWQQVTYTVNIVLTFTTDKGEDIVCSVNGSTTLDPITLNAGESLGSSLPTLADIVVPQEFAKYNLYGWFAQVNGVQKGIEADTAFTTEIFGVENITIDVCVVLGTAWSERH